MLEFHASILTIFPEMFPATLQYSLAGQALKEGIWGYDLVNIRDFGLSKHQNVDDTPYGGGNGMVMRPDVVGEAIDYSLQKWPTKHIYYMSPRGKPIKQAQAKQIAQEKEIMIICGRFEGLDERVIKEYDVAEISIGDFILSGGELAALALLDSCIRLLPGVLKNQDTLSEESFSYGVGGKLLEYPLYTKPSSWRGHDVPGVLLSGNHAEIAKWRYEKALEITKQQRPDLLV